MLTRHRNLLENIKTYINIRESNRCTLSLCFEATESNKGMLNESILKFYLERLYKLPTKSFRFLNIIDYVAPSNLNQNLKRMPGELILTQMFIEIVHDWKDMQSKTAQVKQDILDGSSLLYDLQPAYVEFNLGQTGLATMHRIADFRLLYKEGKLLGDKEYLVSLMRHKSNVTTFMVMAFNMLTNEEHVLELLESDIY